MTLASLSPTSTTAISRARSQPSPPPFRIAIIGGAIGGLTTALFLHNSCCQGAGTRPVTIDVYEQTAAYREIGAGIGLGVNAAWLLHEMAPEVRRACEAIGAHWGPHWFNFVRYDTGECAFTLPAGKGRRTAEDAAGEEVRGFGVARSDLLAVLLAALRGRKGVKLWTAKRCVDVVEVAGGADGAAADSVEVRVHFADGTRAEADLVIGADGIHSVVRHSVCTPLLPGTTEAPYSGRIAYRGVVPLAALAGPWPLARQPLLWFAPGRHFLTFPIAADTALSVVAFVTRPAAALPAAVRESWTHRCSRADVAADFADFPDLVQRIIALLPDQSAVWRIHDHPPLERWVWKGGRVVLLGDAAHAMTPHQGAGAGQAIEDAYILARAVVDYLASESGGEGEGEEKGGGEGGGKKTARAKGASPGLEAWMEGVYQRVRRPRAQQVQKTSRVTGDLYELMLPDFEGKTYEECIPVLQEKMEGRFNWLWAEDMGVAYAEAKAALLGQRGVVD
ncbi:hypothetical protein P8C59_003717 [Phyllachora maydis]|nr:hypothetical protein P8C59_003717 [Phyllachora maydis]